MAVKLQLKGLLTEKQQDVLKMVGGGIAALVGLGVVRARL